MTFLIGGFRLTNFGDFRLTVFGQFNPTLTSLDFVRSSICRASRAMPGIDHVYYILSKNMTFPSSR